MSLPAMSLGLRGGGWGQRAWLPLGLVIKSPWSALGGPFLSSSPQNGLRNGLLAMSGLHIGQWSSFSLCRGNHCMANSCDYWKLIRKWVWFELWICTRWLQWHFLRISHITDYQKSTVGVVLECKLLCCLLIDDYWYVLFNYYEHIKEQEKC